MKQFKKLFAMALLAIAMAGGLAHAGSSYTVNLTTYVPAGALAGSYTLGAFPNITGNLYVRKLVVSASTNTTNQTITLYDTCAATTTAAVDFKFYLNAVTAGPELNMAQFDFLPQSFKLTSPCFIKSDTATNVQLTVFYE